MSRHGVHRGIAPPHSSTRFRSTVMMSVVACFRGGRVRAQSGSMERRRAKTSGRRGATVEQTPGRRYIERAAGQALLAAMQRLMQQRLGRSPEERLRWVVDFTHRDLKALRREERIALGYDLRLIATLELPLAGGVGGLTTSGQP